MEGTDQDLILCGGHGNRHWGVPEPEMRFAFAGSIGRKQRPREKCLREDVALNFRACYKECIYLWLYQAQMPVWESPGGSPGL